jgi:carbon-monoxide dehydrogenase medium subunit
MDYVTLDEEGVVHVGCMVTHNACLSSEIIRQNVHCLYEACEQIGSPQIRNRGTIIGNITTASPANDTISALMVLEAKLQIRSLHKSRVVKIEDFFTGPRKTLLEKNEIITEIFFTLPNAEAKTVFMKNGLRKAQAIAVINTATYLEIKDSKIVDVRIALGAVAPVIIRASQTEKFLLGKVADNDLFIKAGNMAADEAKPISDIRSSSDYRKKMVAVLVKRSLIKGLEGNSEPYASPVTLWGKSKKANSPLKSASVEFQHESTINLKINGKDYSVKGAFDKNLMDLLRENVLLTGTKEGCGEGECGACTIYMDGVAVLACLIPAPRAHNTEIVTIEGVQEEGGLHKVQKAFIEEGAVQCGYCTPGFVMSSVKLIEEKQNPSRDEIETAISGNLCRCTGYYKIISAIEKAAEG